MTMNGSEGARPLELRKQISIFVPISDWRMIREEAARKRIPMTELCRRWMRPEIADLRRRSDPRRTAAER